MWNDCVINKHCYNINIIKTYKYSYVTSTLMFYCFKLIIYNLLGITVSQVVARIADGVSAEIVQIISLVVVVVLREVV